MKKRPLPKSEPKDARPDGSEEQRGKLGSALRQEIELLSEESYAQTTKTKDSSVSELLWIGSKDIGAKVLVSRGKHIISMGKTICTDEGSFRSLCFEEVLFLSEVGSSQVYQKLSESNDCVLLPSSKEVWELCIASGMKLEHYLTFSYLKRLGYVVRIFGQTEITPITSQKHHHQPLTQSQISPPSPSQQTQQNWWPNISTEQEIERRKKLLPHVSIVVNAPQMITPNSTMINGENAIPKFIYDVWKPGSQERFMHLQPHFRVVIMKYNDIQPGILIFEHLIQSSFPIPVHIAIVSDASVSFFSLGTFS